MTPEDYENILRSLRKSNPSASDKELKTRAAKITNARRKKAGKPPARFHVNKRKRG